MTEQLLFFERGKSSLYQEDGLTTYHAHAFLLDPRFQKARTRAAKAGGFDYMVSWRLHTILWAAARAERVPGDFVECGTARGFMASGICDYLNWDTRPFFLFDTFIGANLNAYYAGNPEEVRNNFLEWSGVRLVVGEVPGTLANAEIETVAFLHIDMNNAPAEEAALRYFWPKLTAGGTVIFDDYGFPGFEAGREAANNVASEFGFDILTLPTGQGMAIK